MRRARLSRVRDSAPNAPRIHRLRTALIALRRKSYLRLTSMKMQFRLPGGDLEYAVLAKLWELGSATAREIHAQGGGPAGLVSNTTAKRLMTRERKGLAFIYRPCVARTVVDAERARVFLTRLLGPAPRAAMATL